MYMILSQYRIILLICFGIPTTYFTEGLAKISWHQLSGVFSGLLAAAIQNMDGIGGRPGWAWIFILVCITIAFASCWLSPLFPSY